MQHKNITHAGDIDGNDENNRIQKPPQRLNLRTNAGPFLSLRGIRCVDCLFEEVRVQVGDDLGLAKGSGSQRDEPASSPAMHSGARHFGLRHLEKILAVVRSGPRDERHLGL